MCLLSDIQLHCGDAVFYADIDGYRAHILYYYHPDIFIYNEQHHRIQLVELICPFNTTDHL